MNMFCYQCEQAAGGEGCSKIGICGKQPETAALQDIIVHQLKGIGYLAHAARQLGKSDPEINRFTVEALFTTVTNVNFDPQRLVQWIAKAKEIRDKAEKMYDRALAEAPGSQAESPLPAAARFVPASTQEELLVQAAQLGILADYADEDIRSLSHLLTYGLKGMAAYADHASILGVEDDEVYAFTHQALAALNNQAVTAEELLELNLGCGRVNIRCMEILDQGHTSHFGHPEPTSVPTDLKPGPAIVVSGHDLLDLEVLLKQTQGQGINIYTHGEMLPAHGYPGLKKYPHLAGHFGTAWQNQQKEFDGLPAAFLFTTNCIQKPRNSYRDRVFTCGLVGWPGITHIKDRDFSPVIAKARELGGVEARPGKALMTGFAHHAVLGVADRVIDGVKKGAIRHFFLVGGCDGAKPGRNYYTDLAQQIPEDCLILTLACGKFRFNHLEFGSIDGLPRLLDIGQCNDAYSAVKIAQALAEAFQCSVNDLPLTLILSWYEQKAVVILLSLLSLGLKGIRIGPSLPAFISPNILKVLVEQFQLKPISTPEQDLQAVLA